MNDEMTPREHSDMRDLLLAGAQRIRPHDSYRRLTSVGVAILIVATVTGGVAAVVNATSASRNGAAVAPTSESSTTLPPPAPSPSPMPTPTTPPQWCEPKDFPRASQPEAALPAPGQHIILRSDPCLTAKSLLGSAGWLMDRGIDVELIQGFQSVAGIEPWTAPLADGSGMCILIRGADRNSWGTIACDTPGTPATVQDFVDGDAVRFVIENDAITVYVTSP